MLNFIEVTQLDVLGFHENYRQLTVAIIMVILGYFVCRPLIAKLVKRQHIVFLTYIILSLLLTVISLNLVLLNNEMTYVLISLQAIAIFGFCLVAVLLYKLLRQFVKQKILNRHS